MKHYPAADSSFLEPRTPPKQIKQEKITKTFQNLISVPLFEHSHQIRHLYLSHNLICSLINIECYTCLESLNVSYNQLEDVTELNRIVHKEKIRRIGLRMNDLQYGYQDYAVALFPNLQRIDDIPLPNTQLKRKYYQTAMYVANHILMSRHRFQQIKKIILKLTVSTNLKSLIESLAQNIFHPQQLQKKNFAQLLALLLHIVSKVNSDCFVLSENDYINTVRKQFSEFLQLILLHFSIRNDLTLLKSIKKYDNIQKGFASIGVYQHFQKILSSGATKYDLRTNPGKYIQNKTSLKKQQHHFNQSFENNENNPYIANEFKHFKIQKQVEFYQRVPIFIYEKNYLEVICSILMNEIKEILEMYKKASQYIMIKGQVHINNHQQVRNQSSKDKKHTETARNEHLHEVHSLNYSNSLPSFGIRQQDEQNLKFQKQNINYKPFKEKQIQQRKTLMKMQNNFHHLSIQKYQLYQINLIYKVFRSLKMSIK